MAHKSGFVNIVGNPNVGKSTLMNAFLGQKLSIITPKAQTTRHRIKGILNGDDYQVVFSDTPGILKPAYKLHELMMKGISEVFEDADVLIYVTDVVENIRKNEEYISRINLLKVPRIVLINKMDVADEDTLERVKDDVRTLFGGVEPLCISAKEGTNILALKDQIVSLLPEAPAFFPKDEISDRHIRFFVAEIIREKIFMNYQQEIPYAVEIEIENYVEEKGITKIYAAIHVTRESQKAIILGHKGDAIKKIGIAARLDIEDFIDTKVYLELFVRVSADWRDNASSLRRFGYGGDK